MQVDGDIPGLESAMGWGQTWTSDVHGVSSLQSRVLIYFENPREASMMMLHHLLQDNTLVNGHDQRHSMSDADMLIGHL